MRYAKRFAQYARQGATVDPDNAYWPLVEAAHWAMADDIEAASQALRRAKGCTGYDDYALDQAELIIEQLRMSGERLTMTEELLVTASVPFPHAWYFRNVARWLPEDAIEARGDLAIASVTLSRTASTPIMYLISHSMARTAFLPNVLRGEEWDERQLQESLDLLAKNRPEDVAELTAARRLASWIRPVLTIDDQAIWDRASEGHYLRWFVGGTLWLAASTLMVCLGPWLARLGNYQWVARFAPFSGFLLMGWVAFALQENASQYMMLWDWHIPEIAVGGFLLGFVALIERYTTIVRWAGFTLSLVVLPVVPVIPLVGLPVVAIWTTLILSGRKPDKWPAVVTGALAPCLLTLPLAIMYSVDAEAGIFTLLLVVTALALPLAWSSNVIARKRQWAAVSILLPCIFIGVAIRMSLVADAAVGLVLEHELQLVEQIRDPLTP
ncbi:MAG: hypothetical protein IH945_04490 [Armatimonadetes bacterium]|nr:hypothetical protein [Armatimonadota bacterium]